MPNQPPLFSNKKQKPKTESRYDVDDPIYSNQWKKLREIYMERHPICQRCDYMNQLNPNSAKQLSVHHIYKRLDFPEYAFDEDKLLTLCDSCHKFFDKLESYNKAKAISIGLEVKTVKNRMSLNRVALLGNINTGKSIVIKAIKELYPDYQVYSIDDFRRQLKCKNSHDDQLARHQFVTKIKQSDKCIAVLAGAGLLWQQISLLISTVIMLESEPQTCISRYIAIPLSERTNWFSYDMSLEDLQEVHNRLKLINANYVINTNDCVSAKDYINKTREVMEGVEL